MKLLIMQFPPISGETEVLGENLPKRHFVHMTRPVSEPGPQRWVKASD
jgi:hypothetical protein